jgi:hypothetical protein
VDCPVTNDMDLTTENETTAALRDKIQPIIVDRFWRGVMGRDDKALERIKGRHWGDLSPAAQVPDRDKMQSRLPASKWAALLSSQSYPGT